ncbi:MAG: sigma factor-like helix-turn-helix DNA-binding protein [Patescibacteria group bacterium]
MTVQSIQFSHAPREAVSALLKNLSSRRMRDIIEKRFGLKGGKRRTLDAIGREYKITRERVRQIEVEALRHLRKKEYAEALASVSGIMRRYLESCGGVVAENYFARVIGSAAEAAHAFFLLNLFPDLHYAPETDEINARWATSEAASSESDKAVASLHERLGNAQSVVSEKELSEIVASVIGETCEHDAFLALSKLIRKNPYGEYGLATRPDINPRGVRDKAYIAMAKRASPMHFREVATAINEAGWSKKRAHPQTVHNELIKDSRFVLVGRGLYALSEWGYEPGIVRDVVVSVLKDAACPLTKEDIIERVAAKRRVKAPTILLNLQNKKFFARTKDDKFTLV